MHHQPSARSIHSASVEQVGADAAAAVLGCHGDAHDAPDRRPGVAGDDGSGDQLATADAFDRVGADRVTDQEHSLRLRLGGDADRIDAGPGEQGQRLPCLVRAHVPHDELVLAVIDPGVGGEAVVEGTVDGGGRIDGAVDDVVDGGRCTHGRCAHERHRAAGGLIGA